ncbi:MAG: two-component sensor histidine kinase [Rhodospirillaceae bacterium]|nr:two-component sensor histidine kinase [Rhodospirillales bacterium]
MVASFWRRLLRPRGLLIVMAAFYAVMSGAVGAYIIWTDRAETQHAIQMRTADVAQLLDEHLNRTLDAAEQVLQRISADQKAIAAMLAAAPYLSDITLVDANGRLIVDARGNHPQGSTLAERDWVRALRADTKSETFIGPVAFDEVTRSYSFAVARRVTDASGTVLGMAAAMVDLEHFKRFYRRLDTGPETSMGIYRLDGAVLAREPFKVDDVGRNFAASTLFTTYLPQSPSGTFRGRSPHDAVERLMSYRTLPERKLVVWVGVGDEAALASWRLRMVRTIALAVASVAAMFTLTGILVRELARERRSAADLINLNRDLARSNADLEQFAYVASHDLKEPLRNIASYVQLLQRRYHGRLDPDADAFIGYTVDGVRRMQSIINELLAYSRIGTGELTMVPVQAGILVSTALTHLKGVIAEAQAVVEVKSPLPVVEADAAQLGSLFQNLIGNALKYRAEDVRAEVVVGCEDRGTQWAFYVRDNGIGIDPQYHSQIFDLFKRLHPRDRYPGTGIGLAICQRVVERHGGRIWVESGNARGSTFWFTLPKRRGQ